LAVCGTGREVVPQGVVDGVWTGSAAGLT
jgi:hypothetical protein